VKHSTPSIDALASTLERVLRAELDLHQQLLRCVREKRESVRTAAIARVTEICVQERTLVQALTTVEKQRVKIIGDLSKVMKPESTQPLTLTAIALETASPQQDRLLAFAGQLRETVTDLRRESSIVRSAAESLSRHMSGVVQTVHAALSRARVYGDRGQIAMGSQVQSVVDIRS
jgi:hypothetical protein